MIFKYKAVDNKGAETFGEVEALDQVQAVRDLNARNLIAIELLEYETDHGPSPSRKATVDELVMSFHEMVTLLESGVSISDTLESQCLANYPVDLSESYKLMAREIKKGGSFSSALIESELKIPGYIHQLARAGELAGDLADCLRNGLNQFEYERGLARDFRSALTYPTILIFSGVSAVLIIFTLVVPKFLPILERTDDLPFLSYLVFNLGGFFYENALLVSVLIVSLFSVFVVLFRMRAVKEALFDVCSGWPVIGNWLVQTDVARWCSTLGALLASKVELLQAITLANEGVFSRRRRARFDRVIAHLKEGDTLADSLESESVLTPAGYNLIRSGEKAGKVSQMVISLAKLYDEASRNRMKKVMSLVEPLSILVVGILIGGIVLGVMLGITSANMTGV